MFVKRYIAKDMSEAMEKIRSELGSEAVILSHRSMRQKGVTGFLKKKMVEVMVAYEPAAHGTIGLEPASVQTVAEPSLLPTHRESAAPPPLRQAPIHSEALPARQSAPARPQPAAAQKQAAPPPVAPAKAQAQKPAGIPAAAPTKRPAPPPAAPAKAQAPATGRSISAPAFPTLTTASAAAPAPQLNSVLQYQQAAIQARYPTPPTAAGGVAPATASAATLPDAAPVLQQESPAQEAQCMPAVFRAPEGGTPAAAAAPAPAEPAFETAQFPRLTDAGEGPAASAGSDARIDELTARLAELKGVVRSLTSRILTADKEGLLQFSPEVMKIYQALLEQDVQVALCRSICEQVQSTCEEKGGRPAAIARKLLLELLGKPAPLALADKKQSVVLLTGPTGVGKTTTLVKLAGMFTIREGSRVGFINTDTYRVAAQAQLAAYADVLDIPCITVYSPDEVPVALHSLSDCDLVLIDTAGKSTTDLLYQEELKSLLGESGAREVLLHISASMSAGAAAELIRYYAFLEDYKLVVTKLDEMKTWGCLLNIAASAKRPLSFVTIGQKVPQDIEVPDMLHIVDRILESVGV